ncbi:hypothetical protein PCANC_11010 [Puccinia coronata f. sp. avenae]|uniref:Uncharacterized protein n=1 Tax=Puccinia coronata f. sp. avenae TaxID=200324 RepID=A0A2N5USZ4_9BASI|nr:hypothetical protein PCASD_10168 [Puccinia coronata f. sp. avenae]PLW40880.1 hypothetical protein PCANC_11010 [Puccinia coronata f. sp. avenae]
MSSASQPSILCPLPRRTHSNPVHPQTHTSSSSHPLKPATRAIKHHLQPNLPQELTSSDDVLSEFLSLFTTPSEPSRPPIFIYNKQLDSTSNQSNHSSQPPSPIRTTSSTPLSSSSSSSPSPPKIDDNQLNSLPGNHHPMSHPESIYPQAGLAVAPNHLSSIVSSPISRCHNPLPRHAELDVLASRLPKPFEPFESDPIHMHSKHDEERLAMTQSDHPLSSLMPALTLEPSVLPPSHS